MSSDTDDKKLVPGERLVPRRCARDDEDDPMGDAILLIPNSAEEGRPAWIGREWQCHTVTSEEVQTIDEVINPLVNLAKDYIKERRNGVLQAVAENALNMCDLRAVVRAAVQDFVAYVAHRHETSLGRSVWKEDKA